MTRTDQALRTFDNLCNAAERMHIGGYGYDLDSRREYLEACAALRALLTSGEDAPEPLTASGFVHSQYAAGWNACLARLAGKEKADG